ncbi:MAG: hypothetical protein DMG16_03160 [Acidobacteria bacterium]|nr:MAG: hypothetical protein DMG16_03160 [Acidobacteriota bacterium]
MLCAQAGGLNDAKSPFEVAPGIRFAGPGDQERSASESFPKYVFGAFISVELRALPWCPK